ncbi:7426_t:CDS:2 [Cetraspora pellucida]|uniref:7426_t:CDS:1 n=1 Tax=Cetraspora pellucida TaxID=1433469 RepID=A0A9N8WHS7_9GLOM|nr:7426_t:CDS:2 [Cetraspora pellucida]
MICYYNKILCILFTSSRPAEGINLHLFRHLFQQFIVDAYANIEQDCLNYLKCNQKKIHAELYSSLYDALTTQDKTSRDLTAANIGKCHYVYYQDEDILDEILQCDITTQTTLTAWFKANQKFSSAHAFTYADFPTQTVNDIIYSIFKNTCEALGLLENNNKWDDCLNEAQHIQSGS